VGEVALGLPKHSCYSKPKCARAQRKTLVRVVSCKRYASSIGDPDPALDAAPWAPNRPQTFAACTAMSLDLPGQVPATVCFVPLLLNPMPMKLLFSVVALLVAFVLLMLLSRNQLQGLRKPSEAGSSAPSAAGGLISPQQYKHQLDQAMRASHPGSAGSNAP
jgi:hypothetical protein